MNSVKLMDAIGSINDKYIEKFVYFKSAKRNVVVKRILPVVACLAIVVCLIPLAGQLVSQRTHDTEYKEFPACDYNGYIYSVIDGEWANKKYNLPLTIDNSLLGDEIGNCVMQEDTTKGTVYECTATCGTWLLVGKFDSDYNYMVFGGSSTPLTVNKLYEIYGLTGEQLDVYVDIRKLPAESAAKVVNLFKTTETLSYNEFQHRFFDGKSEEEQVKIGNKLADDWKEIVVCGENTGKLVFGYYQSIGFAYVANSYFELPNELNELLQ